MHKIPGTRVELLHQACKYTETQLCLALAVWKIIGRNGRFMLTEKPKA
jgi:hypothetical protein